jgi:hypothetical protein
VSDFDPISLPFSADVLTVHAEQLFLGSFVVDFLSLRRVVDRGFSGKDVLFSAGFFPVLSFGSAVVPVFKVFAKMQIPCTFGLLWTNVRRLLPFLIFFE